MLQVCHHVRKGLFIIITVLEFSFRLEFFSCLSCFPCLFGPHGVFSSWRKLANCQPHIRDIREIYRRSRVPVSIIVNFMELSILLETLFLVYKSVLSCSVLHISSVCSYAPSVHLSSGP